MKKVTFFLVGVFVMGLVLGGCSSGDQVTDKGAMDKYNEIQKQTDASGGNSTAPKEGGQGD